MLKNYLLVANCHIIEALFFFLQLLYSYFNKALIYFYSQSPTIEALDKIRISWQMRLSFSNKLNKMFEFVLVHVYQ